MTVRQSVPLEPWDICTTNAVEEAPSVFVSRNRTTKRSPFSIFARAAPAETGLVLAFTEEAESFSNM